MSAKSAVAAILGLLGACATPQATLPLADAASGQRAWAAACADGDDWDKSGPPFRVYGNTYYVGTCGITSLLVTGARGHVLIDSGTDAGAQVVLQNIRRLGFDSRDVRYLLMSHEHFDHVGGLARLQQATGAKVLATPAAAEVLASGLVSPEDPQAHSGHPPFPPVSREAIVPLTAEGTRQLAGLTFHPMFTPGHTQGATSWRWQACEDNVCKWIVYADSLNPISSDGYRFDDHPALVAGMRAGLTKVASAPCDIVLAPHPGAAARRARLLGEKLLIDPGGCRTYAASAADRLDKRLASEAAGG